MNTSIYLPRKLVHDGKLFSESELLSSNKFIIILAEPGGGKSDLLTSLANQLSTEVITANVFAFSETHPAGNPLVLDAFDELSKTDARGIDNILGKAKSKNPSHIVISSRSSEWQNANTRAFFDFFGKEPAVTRLLDFDEAEQRLIFEAYAPDEDFKYFQEEVCRFQLDGLLPNPQFLKMFSDAYIASERVFKNKQSIFTSAVDHLAREENVKIRSANSTITSTKKVSLAAEVFAKIYLSGSEGVSSTEFSGNPLYPHLSELVSNDTTVSSILATRLFKPSANVDHHEPVHKIVAEYCAATYLVKLVSDPSDQLSISILLSVLAPNNVVRDDLRGTLGWIASSGDLQTQKAVISLDPYAVLANGDPSQLHPSSIRLLIQRLVELDSIDPYFRRGDYRRSFSLSGFFGPSVVPEIKPILLNNTGGQLRGLLLEIINDTATVHLLRSELLCLALSEAEEFVIRSMAIDILLSHDANNICPYLNVLMFESSNSSLQLASRLMEKIGTTNISKTLLVSFFLLCANLYPTSSEPFNNLFGKRIFIKYFIVNLDTQKIVYLLDSLTANLTCRCGNKWYECYCRIGISKIVGLLVDQYFDRATPPYDPKSLWQWLKMLNFRDSKSPNDSSAVKLLNENTKLKQGIISTAYTGVQEQEELENINNIFFGATSHSGLHINMDDRLFIINSAYESDNVFLWNQFIQPHNFYLKENQKESQRYRHIARQHALKKYDFMKVWALAERTAKIRYKQTKKQFRRLARSRSKHEKQEIRTRQSNHRYIQANYELVKSGQDWGTLLHFAKLRIFSPEDIQTEIGDTQLVKSALINCTDYLRVNTPDLGQLAELRCKSSRHNSLIILYASCIETLQVKGNLDSIDKELLRSLRTRIDSHYPGISRNESDSLESEIDKQIFTNPESKDKFIQQYLEPQIHNPTCFAADVSVIQVDTFKFIRSSKPLEWLKDIAYMPLGTISALFDLAVEFGDRHQLLEVIFIRCEHIMSLPLPSLDKEIEHKRKFWLIRGWIFLENTPEEHWNHVKRDNDNLLELNHLTSSFHSNQYPSWPNLTALKIESILDAYIDRWPKVDLPSTYGTESPKEETAYRFLTEVIWNIRKSGYEEALPVLDRLLCDPRFLDMHNDLKSIKAEQLRNKALSEYKPPNPIEIVRFLDEQEVVSVPGLRKLIIDELTMYQSEIDGVEFDIGKLFFESGKHKNEEDCTLIIADRLRLRLQARDIIITPEHQLANAKRSDFTLTKLINGSRRLLVTEVKGQWHRELYTAAAEQLHKRYSSHPNAEEQGVYIALWFGKKEEVAGLKNRDIDTADELKKKLESEMPIDIANLIDVFVLDLSHV